MIVALGGVGQNARAAAAGWIADVVPGDLVVTSIRPIAADEDVPDSSAAASPASPGEPDRDRSMSRSTGSAPMPRPSSAPTCWPTAGSSSWPATATTALAALDAGGATVIPRALADRLGLAVGDVAGGPDERWRPAGPHDRRYRRAIDPGQDRGGDARRLEGRDDSLGVAGADVFAVRFAPNAPDSARAALEQRPTSSPSRSSRSTRSKARSATPSDGSSGCSMPSPRWP